MQIRDQKWAFTAAIPHGAGAPYCAEPQAERRSSGNVLLPPADLACGADTPMREQLLH